MKSVFYLTAIAMAFFVVTFTIFYINFAMITQKKKSRILIIIHPIFTLLFVLISSFFIEKIFYDLSCSVDLLSFYVIWGLPYGITVITMLKKWHKI